MHISSYIDHTLLKATATGDDIRELCAEAVLYNFYAVCVNSSYVKLCHELLNSSNTRIASVTGFPLGAMDTCLKYMKQNRPLNMVHMRLIWS
jgi:deoxyribose-phosphate aldolase